MLEKPSGRMENNGVIRHPANSKALYISSLGTETDTADPAPDRLWQDARGLRPAAATAPHTDASPFSMAGSH